MGSELWEYVDILASPDLCELPMPLVCHYLISVVAGDWSGWPEAFKFNILAVK